MSATTAPSHDPSAGTIPVDASAVVRTALARHADEPGALLPVLHDIQHVLGHVPALAVPLVAAELNLSRAEVHGVLTYYTQVRREPAAAHVIQVCRAEACRSMGAETLFAHVRERLGCVTADASADGRFQVEAVYCLGLCASSPALFWNDTPHARVTPESFDRLVARASRAGEAGQAGRAGQAGQAGHAGQEDA